MTELIWDTADVKTCPHNFIFLSQCIECKYLKLLEFVKRCAEGEKYINDLCEKYDIDNNKFTRDEKALYLLKEMGES
jgi:hypothetical protein